ncbi:MAG: AraD1 family protein, partial [Brevundimonas sp.]
MPLRLIQYRPEVGGRAVAAMADAGPARRLIGVDSVHALALEALDARTSLSNLAEIRATGEVVDLDLAESEGRLLSPIDHPDPAHLKMTGTGLTHLGSAEGRDKMHKAAAAGAETDSMRMFRMGLEGGKPDAGQIGAQPEWFYKGDGSSLTAGGRPLVSPAFALDGGEEPEIAGIYIIDDSGAPRRLGFALANEFSDHVTERGNYLWLAHSKLRTASIGPELRLGTLPQD